MQPAATFTPGWRLKVRQGQISSLGIITYGRKSLAHVNVGLPSLHLMEANGRSKCSIGGMRHIKHEEERSVSAPAPAQREKKLTKKDGGLA